MNQTAIDHMPQAVRDLEMEADWTAIANELKEGELTVILNGKTQTDLIEKAKSLLAVQVATVSEPDAEGNVTVTLITEAPVVEDHPMEPKSTANAKFAGEDDEREGEPRRDR